MFLQFLRNALLEGAQVPSVERLKGATLRNCFPEAYFFKIFLILLFPSPIENGEYFKNDLSYLSLSVLNMVKQNIFFDIFPHGFRDFSNKGTVPKVRPEVRPKSSS